MITIRSDRLSVTISPFGAELQSVLLDGKERLWQGNEKYWTGRAPILFPICGGVKNNTYSLGGKTFSLPKHGFARTATFEGKKLYENAAAFTLTDNEQTQKQYPYHFALTAIYKVIGTELSVEYLVENKNDDIMYFSIGAHEAYALESEVENYSVQFELPEDFNAYELSGNEVCKTYRTILKNSNVLPLKDDYFSTDALVFKTLRSRKATLINNETKHGATLSFPGNDYFLIWKKPEALYVCMEPWSGIPDSVDSDGVFEHKEGILTALPHKTYTQSHTISFF